MYAGYDTYWMYDNRRHEPEPYFQKNDNNLCHTLPHRQKQMQGKGSSNNMYNYAPHPNTVTTSHHNDQPRVTNTQSMLPPQACLQPYPSSLKHQYLPDEVCSAQPNSVPDSLRLTCVPLQNQVLRNVQNYNPGQTVNYKASAYAVNNREGCNNKTQMSCIRVKDFSLLNNNNKNNNCNSLLVSGYHQSQQKRPWYYLHDSPENKQNKTSSGQMQRDCSNHTATAEVNYSNLNYGSTPSYHVSNEEQYSQCSATLYQHSAQYERQVCHDNSNYPAAQRKNSTRTVIQEADEQRRLDSGRHSDNNAYNCTAFNMSEPNEVNPASQAQLARPEPFQNALQSPSISTSRTDPTAKSPSHNSNNEGASFRVTVPASAKTTPNLDNSTEASKNSDSSSTSSNLVNTTLRDCAGDGVSNQKEGFDRSEDSAGSAGSGMSQLDQQEPGCVRNEENQNQNLRKETVIVLNSERVSGSVIVPKAENPGLEKDSLKNEKAGCPEEAKVIKSEVDSSVEKEKTANIEQMDSAESGRPKTEGAENTESLLSESPKDKPETVSTTLNESQESDVVILDETETCIKSAEDGGERDHLEGEDKCKSKIDRVKLDLLIEFLKGDAEPLEVLTIGEDDSPPPATNPQVEEPPKKNRRKLNKARIVRNKNTEREMISLVSYKTPMSSSVKSSSTEETKIASPESSDCSKDNDSVESVSEEEEEEEEEEERQGSTMPEEEEYDRSPTESTCDCSCDGRGITREERTLINIMRAFQNLKKHFCANCAFTSPVESIWINIVSGELHCLNCFKKMISKAEENHWSNSKKCRADGSSRLKAAVARKDEEGSGKGNEDGKNPEKRIKCEGQAPAKEARRREDLKDRVEEKPGICFEKSGDLKKDGGGIADKKKRETRSDEVEKPRKTKSTEEAFFGALTLHEKHRKKGGDEAVDSSDGSRKRSKSAEEFVPRKKPILEEDEGDLRRNKVIRRDRRFSRSPSRDSFSSQGSTISGKEVEKSKKHESGRSKTPSLTEGCTEQKSHKTKEGRAEHESKRRGHEAAEKVKRKSMSPEEEIDLKRARIKNSSEKLKADVEKNKTVEKRIDERAEKTRKNGEVKERSRSPKNHEEDSRKSEKAVSSSVMMKRKWKRGKPKLSDPPYIPPWGASAEERKPSSKMFKRSEEIEPHLPKIQKKKRERSASEDEEITKHSCQKTTKISVEKPAGKHNKSSKQCLISKLFKGKRCLKVNPSSKYLNKEIHKIEPQREEERGQEKETKESRCLSHPGSMSSHRTVDSSKKRHSGEEPTEGKDTQQRPGKKEEEAPSKSPKEDKRDKPVGGILEGIVDETRPKISDSESPLFIRLMKTTTKLSLRLLGET